MPVSVHEYDMARMERTIVRQWIAIIVLIVCLAGICVGFFVYESQFQDVVIEQDADTWEGGSNYLNGTGDFNYGTRTPDNQNPGEP